MRLLGRYSVVYWKSRKGRIQRKVFKEGKSLGFKKWKNSQSKEVPYIERKNGTDLYETLKRDPTPFFLFFLFLSGKKECLFLSFTIALHSVSEAIGRLGNLW